MSLFHEQWRQEAYYPRAFQHLRDLPQNHIKSTKQVPFKFHDYKANSKLPCLAYQRTYLQCLNNYGVEKAHRVPQCFQMKYYFDQCLTIHSYFAFLKRINPQQFAQNPYSRNKPTLQDIGF